MSFNYHCFFAPDECSFSQRLPSATTVITYYRLQTFHHLFNEDAVKTRSRQRMCTIQTVSLQYTGNGCAKLQSKQPADRNRNCNHLQKRVCCFTISEHQSSSFATRLSETKIILAQSRFTYR